MRVAGATLVRNARILDFPVVEAVRSVLPLVDEMVVNVGRSRDDTLATIRTAFANEPAVRVLDSDWSAECAGRVLAVETQRAIDAVDADWVVYVQADEVLSDGGAEHLRRAMERHVDDCGVEGLLVDFLHHYGGPDIVATARTWYRREVRVIRTGRDVRSYHEAQGFRVGPSCRRVRAVASGARYHHYGWSRPLRALNNKLLLDRELYGRTRRLQTIKSLPWQVGLKRFEGPHPSWIRDWLNERRGTFAPIGPPRWTGEQLRLLVSAWIEGLSGTRPFEYRNYVAVDDASVPLLSRLS